MPALSLAFGPLGRRDGDCGEELSPWIACPAVGAAAFIRAMVPDENEAVALCNPRCAGPGTLVELGNRGGGGYTSSGQKSWVEGKRHQPTRGCWKVHPIPQPAAARMRMLHVYRVSSMLHLPIRPIATRSRSVCR